MSKPFKKRASVRKSLEVLELFAGIGGIGIGFENTGGFKVIGSVENDEFCNKIRRRHWPDVPQFGDVREFPPKGYKERPDVIVGGSPCQDLSFAGKRAGLGGERSGLFLEMVRIIRELSPRYVVWENVRGVFSSNGGRDFRAVLGHFSDLGYDAEWVLLRASDFGYPQKRGRVFIVAYPKSQQYYRVKQNHRKESKTTWGSQNKILFDTQPMRGLVQYDVPGPKELSKWKSIVRKEDWRAPSIESGLCRDFNGFSIVVDASSAARLKALGNAVVPACAEWIARRILEWENLKRKRRYE